MFIFVSRFVSLHPFWLRFIFKAIGNAFGTIDPISRPAGLILSYHKTQVQSWFLCLLVPSCDTPVIQLMILPVLVSMLMMNFISYEISLSLVRIPWPHWRFQGEYLLFRPECYYQRAYMMKKSTQFSTDLIDNLFSQALLKTAQSVMGKKDELRVKTESPWIGSLWRWRRINGNNEIGSSWRGVNRNIERTPS